MILSIWEERELFNSTLEIRIVFLEKMVFDLNINKQEGFYSREKREGLHSLRD